MRQSKVTKRLNLLAALAGAGLLAGAAQANTVTNSWTVGNFSALPTHDSATYFSIVNGSSIAGLGDSNQVLYFNDSNLSNDPVYPSPFNLGTYFQTLGAPGTVALVFSELEAYASNASGGYANSQFQYYSGTPAYDNKAYVTYTDASNNKTNVYLETPSGYDNLITSSTSMVTVSSATMTTVSNYSSNGALIGQLIPVSITDSHSETAWLTGVNLTFLSQKGIGKAGPAYIDNYTITATATLTSVPEPATLALLAVGGLVLIAPRFKRWTES